MTETYFDIACKVLKMAPDELRNRINISQNDADIMVKQAWERINPQTEDEIIRFYTDHIEYTLFHLVLNSYGNKDYIDPTLYRKLKTYIPNIEELNILDYGCGSGMTSISLINSGCKNVILADINTPLFEIAKQTLYPKGKFMALKGKYPLADNYDLIICLDVLEHVKDPHEVFRHLVAHCRYIYVSTYFDGWNINPSHLKENCEKYYYTWKGIIDSYGLKPISIGERFNGLYSR